MLWYITFGNSCYRGVNSPKRTFNLLAPMVENPNNGLQSCHELRLKISYALGILHSAECFQYEVWSMSIVRFAMSYLPTFSHDVLIWSNQTSSSPTTSSIRPTIAIDATATVGRTRGSGLTNGYKLSDVYLSRRGLLYLPEPSA